jgi:hypothetical protein
MDYIQAAIITPHDGTPIMAITAYMPQLHTKPQEQTYLDIPQWVNRDIITKYKDTTILMGGDLQATPSKEDVSSYYPPLNHFCETTVLTQVNPMGTYTFIPAKTHMDHWLLHQAQTQQHYTPSNIKVTTHTPEYGDRKVLAIEVHQIGDIQPHKTKRNYPSPTTRSHQPCILPIPQNLIDLCRLGNDTTTKTIQYTAHGVTTMLTSEPTTTDQIDVATTEVMTLIHNYHDIATKILPMQATKQDTPTPVKLKPHIS